MPHTAANQILLLMHGKNDLMNQADCYLQGLYVKRSRATALKLYTRAAREGFSGANFKIGQLEHHRPGRALQAAAAYLDAAFEANLCAKIALQELLSLANAAEKSIIKLYIGRAFEHEQNWLKAQEWYISAGSAAAIYRVGMLHKEDRKSANDGPVLITKNKAEELLWYKQSAACGHEAALLALKNEDEDKGLACFYLGQIHELASAACPRSETVKYYMQASRLANADARFRLGKISERGELGEAINPKAACEFFMLAVELRHPEALSEALRLTEALNEGAFNSKLAELYYSVVNDRVLAVKWFKKALERGYARAFARMNEISGRDPEFAYQLAKLYEEDTVGEQSVQKAIPHYAMAIRNNHLQARLRIAFLAESRNADAQYVLAYEYYHCKCRDHLTAINGCMQAAEQGHVLALAYLTETVFTADLYFLMATRYERAEGVAVNTAHAILFYKKASQFEHMNASFRLGQIHDTGEFGVPVNYGASFGYYLLAAKKGHPESLLPLERLANDLDNKESDCQFAEVCLRPFNNKMLSLKWFKKSVDKGYARAQMMLREIAKADPEFAYAAAKLYEEAALADRIKEKRSRAEKNAHEALNFYVLAIRNQHPEARAWLEAKATSGNVNAQFALGYVNFHYDQNKTQAVIWFMRAAEEGHAEALDYLNKQAFSRGTYLKIANCYEKGLGVAINIDRAIQFYTKAYNIDDKGLAFKLGELCEESCLFKNKDTACNFYAEAARNGDLDAEAALLRLTKAALTDIQLTNSSLGLGSAACLFRLSSAQMPVSADSAVETTVMTSTYNNLNS